MQKHMNAIFTLQHMHTHNQLPYGNAPVGQRTAKPVLDLKQCCHSGTCVKNEEVPTTSPLETKYSGLAAHSPGKCTAHRGGVFPYGIEC